MSDEEKKDRGFKVTDHRMFSEGEEPEKSDTELKEETPVSEPQGETPEGSPPIDSQEKQAPAEGEAPPLNFSQFIMSLATSALIQMGEAKHPQTGESMENVAAARQTIDIIGILKEKTSGNLDPEEQQLIDNILAELRFRFVNKKS